MPITTEPIRAGRARVARALAHPTRLALLEALAAGALCVCDLAEIAGAETSTVSRHLSLLRNAGLVASRRDGQRVEYRSKLSCMEDLWRCLDSALVERTRELQRALPS